MELLSFILNYLLVYKNMGGVNILSEILVTWSIISVFRVFGAFCVMGCIANN